MDSLEAARLALRARGVDLDADFADYLATSGRHGNAAPALHPALYDDDAYNENSAKFSEQGDEQQQNEEQEIEAKVEQEEEEEEMHGNLSMLDHLPQLPLLQSPPPVVVPGTLRVVPAFNGRITLFSTTTSSSLSVSSSQCKTNEKTAPSSSSSSSLMQQQQPPQPQPMSAPATT
jgi:hypothetical protein